LLKKQPLKEGILLFGFSFCEVSKAFSKFGLFDECYLKRLRKKERKRVESSIDLYGKYRKQINEYK
jgi:hypothetical protein